MRVDWNKLVFKATVRASVLLPEAQQRRVQRRARGRRDAHRLRRADYVIVSHGKSGRTWLRVMLSRFYQVRHGLPKDLLLGFDNLHRLDPAIPTVLFTHDGYIRHHAGNGKSKADYRDKRVILLVRHPADVAVSWYFEWLYRMPERSRWLEGLPPADAELPLFDFIMQGRTGLRTIVAFMNEWARALPEIRELLMVRYEDMRASPEAALGQVLDFMSAGAGTEEIAEAVRFSSFERMRKLERNRVFRQGERMQAKDPDNPDSFKVRRGKVGGYRDYFDDDEVRRIDAFIRVHLDPVFGYAQESAASP